MPERLMNGLNDKATKTAILLVGFMGSGKTTVGRVLAARLDYAFVDLDEMIERQVGMRVCAIFQELGEAKFREFERRALQGCKGLIETVIALGGGALVTEENRNLAQEIGRTVWLDCPLEVCLSRIAGDVNRPLLNKPGEMQELMNTRKPTYQLADLTVQAGDGSAEEIVARIISRL